MPQRTSQEKSTSGQSHSILWANLDCIKGTASKNQNPAYIAIPEDPNPFITAILSLFVLSSKSLVW